MTAIEYDPDAARKAIEVLRRQDEHRAEEIARLEFALAAERAKMLLLRAAVEAFIETVNAAVRANRRGRGGQHVPFHGDFCSAAPSVMGRLEWWARNLGEHLPKEGM